MPKSILQLEADIYRKALRRISSFDPTPETRDIVGEAYDALERAKLLRLDKGGVATMTRDQAAEWHRAHGKCGRCSTTPASEVEPGGKCFECGVTH